MKGMHNDLALDVRSLVVDYGTVRAVDGATFGARRGAVTAVVGPNGAGKTSCIEACEGYRRTYGGTISVLGLDPLRDHRALTSRMGVMLQGGGVYPSARVGETVRHYCALYERPKVTAELIDRMGLAGLERRTWRALSGGEKQRLSLALALAGRPEILFLDEPTAGVDIDGRTTIRQLLRQLADEGCAVILATHELDEAERCADDVIVIDRGRVLRQSTLVDLLGSTREIRFATSSVFDVSALSQHVGAAVSIRDGGFVVEGSSDPALIGRISEWLMKVGVSMTSVAAGTRRLEDVLQDLRRSGST